MWNDAIAPRKDRHDTKPKDRMPLLSLRSWANITQEMYNMEMATSSEVNVAIEEFRGRVIKVVCPFCRAGQPIVEIVDGNRYHAKGQGCYANKIWNMEYSPENAPVKNPQ